jgi:hypothetical protein
VANGQEPAREIVALKSGQTLVDRGRYSLRLGLACDFRDLLDRFVDCRILMFNAIEVPLYQRNGTNVLTHSPAQRGHRRRRFHLGHE